MAKKQAANAVQTITTEELKAKTDALKPKRENFPAGNVPAKTMVGGTLPDKVPAPSTLVKPLRDFAAQDAQTQLEHYASRLEFLKTVILTYKHDLETLKQYPGLLRVEVAKRLGVDLEKNRKLWPEGAAKEWDKISQSILIPVNRIWSGLELDGTKKVLEVLSNKGTLQQKVALMPRLSTKGRKSTPPAPAGTKLAENITVTGVPANKPVDKPAIVSVPLRTLMDSIDILPEDFIATLLQSTAKRLAISKTTEWQMLAREITAVMDKYDQRVHGLPPKQVAAEAGKKAA